MTALSTLRHSLTKLVTTCVTWHPKGITAVRRFTIEPCVALPSRILKCPPSSPIKNANPEAAAPFKMIPEPEDDIMSETWSIVQGEVPEEPLCHTHNMSYIRTKAWLQQLEGGVEINKFYMNSELPLSCMKDDIEELYD